MKNTVRITLTLTAGFALFSCNKKVAPGAPKEIAQNPDLGGTPRLDSISAKLRPYIDQWDSIPSLSEFRKKLLTDLQSGDQKQILSAFSDEFEINPGTEHGQEGVIEYWGLDGSKEKLLPLKAILDSVLSNGGCLIPGVADTLVRNYSVLWAPFHNCLSDSENEKCGDQGCAVASPSGSPIYKAPALQSQVIAQAIPFEVLSNVSDTICTENFSKCEWIKVARASGEMGFLPSHAVKSWKDGFLKVWKEPSGWKIMVLRFPGIVTEE